MNCFIWLSCLISLTCINAESSPVKVELYYESLCPGCREFISGQLFETWKTLQKTGILSVGLYPYGNAKESQLPDGSWKFQCQHGQPECTGNLIEVCIENSVKFDADQYLPAIHCMEASDDPVSNAEACVKENLPGVDYNSVDQCAKGKLGNILMHQMGKKTESLDPSHTYVPWIVVNGQHTEDIQNEASEHLLALVCDMYTGSKPKECHQQTGGFFKWMRDTYDKIVIEIMP